MLGIFLWDPAMIGNWVTTLSENSRFFSGIFVILISSETPISLEFGIQLFYLMIMYLGYELVIFYIFYQFLTRSNSFFQHGAFCYNLLSVESVQ